MVVGKHQFEKTTGGNDAVMYDLDVLPEIVNGRTLVPTRAVAEALDCSVNWDGNTQTATISSEKWIDGTNILQTRISITASFIIPLFTRHISTPMTAAP